MRASSARLDVGLGADHPSCSVAQQVQQEAAVDRRGRDGRGTGVQHYQRCGSVFKIVDSMTPQDYLGMVAMTLAFTPFMRPEVFAVLDAGTQPPLAQELRQILAIRDQVPGAARVLTPMAVRACLRDREAAPLPDADRRVRHRSPRGDRLRARQRAVAA
jgi:hypothetical protein